MDKIVKNRIEVQFESLRSSMFKQLCFFHSIDEIDLKTFQDLDKALEQEIFNVRDKILGETKKSPENVSKVPKRRYYKLTKQQLREIKDLLREKVSTQQRIAQHYKISQSMVSELKKEFKL